jgi:hypothetical protein
MDGWRNFHICLKTTPKFIQKYNTKYLKSKIDLNGDGKMIFDDSYKSLDGISLIAND